MKTHKKRNFQEWMRSLHRDIGFLTIGLTLVYALSGVILIYRNTSFLRYEKRTEKVIEANLPVEQLGAKLRMHRFKVTSQKGDTIFFNGGHYIPATGEAVVVRKTYPETVMKLIRLHMMSGRNQFAIVGGIYGILLTFLAISGLFMYKFKSRNGRRGIVLTLLGVIFSVILLLFF